MVNRILQKWSTLKLYFNVIKFETVNGKRKNEFIYASLCDPQVNLYFLFLSYALKMINDINKEMQQQDARIHVFLPRIEFLFKQICRNFIHKELLDNSAISSLNLNNHKPLSDIYCGTQIELYILKNDIDESELNEFKTNVLKFYITFCTELRNRVDFNNFIKKKKCHYLNQSMLRLVTQ